MRRLQVEVCYALPGEQVLVSLELPPDTTLAQAIEASGICQRFEQINLQRDRIGVFGRLREPGEPISDGDRIEIYRELPADPRERRHERVEAARLARARAFTAEALKRRQAQGLGSCEASVASGLPGSGANTPPPCSSLSPLARSSSDLAFFS